MKRPFWKRIASYATVLFLACALLPRGVDAATVTANMAFAPNSIALGASSTLTITLQNSSTVSAATITAFSNDIATMGGHAQIASPSGLVTTCPGGAPSIAGTTISMNGGAIPIAPNGSTPGSCTISVNVIGTVVGNGLDTIHAADVVTSQGSPPGDVTQTLTVQPDDVAVAVPANATVRYGATDDVTFSLHNSANFSLSGFGLSLNSNAGAPYTIVGASTTCGGTFGAMPPTSTSGTVTLSGGAMGATGDCTVTLHVASSSINNVVTLSLPAGAITSDQGATNSGAGTSAVTFVDPDPTLYKVFAPDNVAPGATTTLTILVENPLSLETLTHASFSDAMPSDLTIVSSSASAECGSPTLGGDGTGTFTFSGGTIAPFPQQCQVSVVVSVPGAETPATLHNSIPASSFLSDQTSQAANEADATLTVTPPGGTVSISKSFSLLYASPGQPVQVTLGFTSIGGAFTSGAFVDHLPLSPQPTMVVKVDGSHTVGTSGCGSPTITAPDGAGDISGSGLSIATNATCTVTFWAVLTTPVESLTPVTNSLFHSDVSFTSGGSTVSPGADVSALLYELPLLNLSHYDSAVSTLVNQPATMTTRIVDASGQPDTNVALTLPLNLSGHAVKLAPTPNFAFAPGCPAGLSAANVTQLSGGESFVLNIASIGADCTFTYDVIDEAGAAGTFLPGIPTLTSDDSGGATVSFFSGNSVTFASTGIDLTKSFTPNQIQAGGTTTADITLAVAPVGGFAQTQANGVGVTDTLPSGLAFAPVPNVAFDAGCQAAGQAAPQFVIAGNAITLSFISLSAVGSTATPCNVTFDVTATALGTPSNSIAAGAVTSESGATNVSAATASLTVTAGVGLQKTFLSPTMNIGGSDYARFLLSNSSSATPLANGQLTDTLPSSLTLASTTLGPTQIGDPSACAGAAITTGMAGSTSFVVSGFSVPAYVNPVPGQCVLYVQVTTSDTASPGIATNTIPVGGLQMLGDGIQNETPTSANVTLVAPPSPTIVKSFAPTTVAAGADSLLTITLDNTEGSAPSMTGAGFTDTLPAGLVVSSIPAQTTCPGGSVAAASGADSIVLSGAAISAGATCTVTVHVHADTGGSYVNTIPAGALTTTEHVTTFTPTTATLTATPGLTISKSFSPTAIVAGATSFLTLTVDNSTGASALNDVAFTDTLPTGLTIAAFIEADCGVSANTVAPVGGTAIALTHGQIPAHGACNVYLTVTGTTNGHYVNTIPSSAVTTTEGATNPAPATASLDIASPVTVSKVFAPAAIAPGGVSTVTVTLANNGPSPVDLTGVSAYDPFPSGMVLASPADETTTCGSGLFASNPGDGYIYFYNGTLAAGATCTVSAKVTAATAGSFPNVISAGNVGSDQGISNVDPGSATLTAAPSPVVTKAFSPATIALGATSTLTISIDNSAAGALPLSAVSLPDTLPANVTIAAVPNASTTCGGSVTAVAGNGNVSLAGGALAAGTVCTITVDVTSAVAGAHVNTIPAGALISAEGLTTSADATATLTVTAPGSPVAVSKGFSVPSITAGGVATLTVTLANTGATPVALSNLALNDALPSGMTIAAIPAAATTCGGATSATAGSSVLGLSGATLAAGATCTFSASITAASAGSYANLIPASSVTTTEGVTNVTPANATLDVDAVPPAASPVAVSKGFSVPSITAGGVATLTVTVANTGATPMALSGLALNDALPSGMTIAAVPAAATTCGGTVSAAAGSSVLGLSGATLAVSATCEFSASVTASSTGSYANLIPASSVTTTEGVTNVTPANATLDVNPAPNVTVTKAFAPSLIAPNGTSILTIAVANAQTGSAALSAVTLTDTLPSGVIVAAAPSSATTCGGSITAAAGGSSVMLTGGAMAAGTTCTVTVNVTAAASGTYVNTIPIGAITTTQGATNASVASATLTVAAPNLVVAKTSNPQNATVAPGQTVTYTITVQNTGSADETSSKILDTLQNATLIPGSVKVNGSTEPDAVVTAAQPFGTIAAGTTATITYAATVSTSAVAGVNVSNGVSASGDQPCVGASCSSASSPNVVAMPQLTVDKRIDGSLSETVVAGQRITYALSVSNTGSVPAIGAVLNDPVPAGIVPIDGTVTLDGGSAAGATVSGQNVSVPLGDVPSGSRRTVTFDATVNAPSSGQMANVAALSASGVAAQYTSNRVVADSVAPTLSVSKTSAASVASVGDRVDYTIALHGTSGVAYGATTVVDTLPDYEVYAPGTARANGQAAEPVVTGRRLTWTFPHLTGTLTISYAVAVSNGAPPNGSLTNTVNATAQTGGAPGVGSASATIRILGSTFGSCYPITGRVYADKKNSGTYEKIDVGLGGVAILLDDGESVVTDQYGRYNFPCVRPGMHALRLDESTLPPGMQPFADRAIDSERSTRRLVHRTLDATIVQDVNFAIDASGAAP